MEPLRDERFRPTVVEIMLGNQLSSAPKFIVGHYMDRTVSYCFFVLLFIMHICSLY